MSTCNICFGGEIRNIPSGYSFLSGAKIPIWACAVGETKNSLYGFWNWSGPSEVTANQNALIRLHSYMYFVALDKEIFSNQKYWYFYFSRKIYVLGIHLKCPWDMFAWRNYPLYLLGYFLYLELWIMKLNYELWSWTAPCEDVSSGICGQWRPRSACVSTQSNQDLHCPLTASLETTGCIKSKGPDHTLCMCKLTWICTFCVCSKALFNDILYILY